MAFVEGGGCAGPVVGYLDLQVGRAVPKLHGGRAAGRVADRVGQRFLDDAVSGQGDTRVKCPAGTSLSNGVDAESGTAVQLKERGNVLKPRLIMHMGPIG